MAGVVAAAGLHPEHVRVGGLVVTRQNKVGRIVMQQSQYVCKVGVAEICRFRRIENASPRHGAPYASRWQRDQGLVWQGDQRNL